MSDSVEKDCALRILDKVSGMNLSSCAIQLWSSGTDRMPNSQHFETLSRIVISEKNSSLNFLFRFIDGKFSIYSLDLQSVELFGDKTLNDSLSIALRAVEDYRVLSNASYCDKFVEMISAALQNQSLVVENDYARLEISHVENCTKPRDYLECTCLSWFRKINDQYTIWPQAIYLSISKSGRVTTFMDNLATYYVATTEINISKEDAISIATPCAEAYAKTHGQEVVLANATLEWLQDLNSIRGDNLAIYPEWIVDLCYNATNNEGISNYGVSLWADNGQIDTHAPTGFYGASAPLGVDPMANPWPVFVLIAVVAFTCVGTYAKRRSKGGKRK